MLVQSRLLTVLRFALGALKKAFGWMPRARYGQRVADAQQVILVRGLCEQLRPRRDEPGAES